MIDKVTDDYINDYYRLGYKLNTNFSYLFDLNEVLNKPYNEVYGYFLDNKLVGFIHILIMVDEADIINIIVDDYYRKKGIGSKLIDYCLKKYDLKALNLEVKENNSAIDFYQKLGFKTVRKIPNYYHDQDALFMKKIINNKEGD